MRFTYQEFAENWQQLTHASQVKVWDYMKELRESEMAAIEAKANGMKFEDFNWSVRLRNVFEKEGIQTLSQLADLTELELARTPNVGRLSVKEVKDKLAEIGIELRR